MHENMLESKLLWNLITFIFVIAVASISNYFIIYQQLIGYCTCQSVLKSAGKLNFSWVVCRRKRAWIQIVIEFVTLIFVIFFLIAYVSNDLIMHPL